MKASDIIRSELEFLNLKYPFVTNYKIWHKELLNKVQSDLEKGKPLRNIKKYIRDALNDYYTTYIKKSMRDLNISQAKELLETPKVNIYDIETPIFNLSLNDMIASRVMTHYKSILNNIEDTQLKNINKIKRVNLNTVTSMTYNYLKASRQVKIYSKLEVRRQIKGWLYSAILDRRTSKMCISLNGRFFSRKEYGSRSQLPYIPNVSTHYNCRSTLITIYEDKEIRTYRNETLKEFIENEPSEAKKALGVKRFELLKEGKVTVDDLIDFKRATFYPVKEVVKRIKEG
jgi:SPP1 gp7 family putative phage head morphogenesis protein